MISIRSKSKEINAADVEHLGALFAGGLLLVKGFQKPGMVGKLHKLAGALLIYRGQQGYRRLYDERPTICPSGAVCQTSAEILCFSFYMRSQDNPRR